MAESLLVRLASKVPWTDKILVERTVYEAAARLVSGHGAGAEKAALQRADAAADRKMAAFWHTVEIYLRERAESPRKGLEIVEDVARGWRANVDWNHEPEDLSDVDFAGSADPEQLAKLHASVERMIEEEGKKKGGGSK